MSEDEAGGLADPAGVIDGGEAEEGRYYRVAVPVCECPPEPPARPRWWHRYALVTVYADPGEAGKCPECGLEVPADRLELAPEPAPESALRGGIRQAIGVLKWRERRKECSATATVSAGEASGNAHSSAVS